MACHFGVFLLGEQSQMLCLSAYLVLNNFLPPGLHGSFIGFICSFTGRPGSRIGFSGSCIRRFGSCIGFTGSCTLSLGLALVSLVLAPVPMAMDMPMTVAISFAMSYVLWHAQNCMKRLQVRPNDKQR